MPSLVYEMTKIESSTEHMYCKEMKNLEQTVSHPLSVMSVRYRDSLDEQKSVFKSVRPIEVCGDRYSSGLF